MLLKRVLYILAPLALILTATSCEGKTPGSPETLTPSETISQETEPGGKSLVASPTDYIEHPVTSTTAPPTETMPVIAYENTIPHYAAGTEFIISQIGMTEVTTGWAIGQKTSDSDHILKTTDGGKGWWDVTPPETSPPPGEILYAEAFFLDKSTAWVSYEPYEIVWRTTDAGITWQPARVAMAGNLGATLWFLDAENGWMMKYLDAGMNHIYSALFRTSSGGKFWVKVFDPYSKGDVQSFPKTGLVFADPEIGWLTRDPQGVQPGAFVDATSDGGYTWEKVDLPPPVDEPEKFNQEFCGMFEPELFSTSSGALVVTCRRFDDGKKITSHFLALTSNAGVTWELHDYPGGDLHFINMNLAYALGRDIYKTTDGGKSWTKIKEVNWDGQFNFVNENTAWVVARDENEIALVHTTNGCQTFSEIKPQVINPPDNYLVSPPSAGGGLTPTAASTPTPDSPLPTGLIIEPISRFEAGTAIHSVDFSPDGSQLAVGSDNAAYLLDVGSGQVLRTLDRQPGEVVTTYAALSPDDRLLATCGGGTWDEPIIQLWDFDIGELLLTFEGPYDYINDIAFSPDGRILAAGGGPQDNVVNLYEADTGKLLKTLWHNRFVLSVSFNPIGNTLASAGGDAAAHIWDLDSGEELLTLTGSKDNITDLTWSPDGDKLVAASLDGVLRVWEPVSSRGMQVLGEIGGESLLSVAWMPDSGIIAAGGDLGTLFLWDQDSNQLLMQITQAHQDAINSLKFSPTDRLLATGGADGLVKLWRLQ